MRVNEGREERSQLHVKSLRPKQIDSIVEQETGHFGQFSVDKRSCREDISTRHLEALDGKELAFIILGDEA